MNRTAVTLLSPHIITAQWLPMGVNHLIALNRFVGSHKKYTSATEFGIRGNFSQISRGSFPMDKKGVMLKPGSFDFNNFVNLEMTDTEGSAGIYADSVGSVRIGVSPVSDGSPFVQNTVKELTGMLNRRLVQGFYPVLSETQMAMLSTLYDSEDLPEESYRSISYSLVIAEGCSHEISSTKEFLAESPDAFAPVCDWLTDDLTYGNCHVFIGQSACVCIGKPDDTLKTFLKHLLFIKCLYQVSQRLYARISSLSKDIQQARASIPGAQLKKLTGINKLSTRYAAYFSRLDTLDNMLSQAIDKQRSVYDKFCKTQPALDLLLKDFDIETEKSTDRTLTIEHLKNELDNLNESAAQRMDEIMSRNGEFMNIVLLVMTILTIVGFGDIFGLSLKENLIIAGIMLPFIVVAFVYIRNYFRNYSPGRRRENKKKK